MSYRIILQTWTIAFLIGCAIGALAYLLATAESGSSAHSSLSWFLWPGVALYVALNGSLLFGAGVGAYGDAGVIILGSATAWSTLLAVVLLGYSWFRYR